MLLGFLELTDIAHHDDQRRGRIEIEGLGGNQTGKHLAIAASKRHLQVADAAGLQALQQARPDAGDAPDVEVGGGLANDIFGLETNLFFERVVDFEQAAVGQPRNHQDVRALLKHGGEFLLGESQRFFRTLGVADVDHQSAHNRLMAMLDKTDDIAHPQAAPVGGDNAVIDTMIAPGQHFVIAECLGPCQVRRVDDVAPEPRNEPMGQGIAKQFFGMRRHVAVGEIADPCFPGNCGKALHQPAVMVFTAAQLLFEVDPPGDFRTQPAVNPDDHGQRDHQKQQSGQAVNQQVGPEGSVIQYIAHPVFLNGADFT